MTDHTTHAPVPHKVAPATTAAIPADIDAANAPSGADSGHPAAHPLASTSVPRLTSPDGSIGGPNDGAHPGTIAPRRGRRQRTTTRDLDELESWLSERDLTIVRSVADHQFLTVTQVEQLHFADHAPASGARIARRTLARLRHHRLLGTLPRRVGGVRAGSQGLVHYLDVVGDQLLSGRSGRAAKRPARDPSARFLDHRLAVADTHIALLWAHRRQQLELVTAAVEPAAWRRYPGSGGGLVTLKSDCYAEIAVSTDSDYLHGFFVEIDLGTESIPTVIRKCRDYETYRRSGIEQETAGSFPLVVWSMTHRNPDTAQRRRDALRDAIARDRTLTPALFRIVDPQQLVALLATGGQQ